MRGQSYPYNLKRMIVGSHLAKFLIYNNFVHVPIIENALADDQTNLGANLRLGRLHLEGHLITTLMIQGQEKEDSKFPF